MKNVLITRTKRYLLNLKYWQLKISGDRLYAFNELKVSFS
jgi:hypothetical protein